MRRRRLRLLEGRASKVEKDTHLHAKVYVRLHQVSEANKKAEQEPNLSSGKPDEAFDNEGERVTEQNDPIDVDALYIEDATPDTEKNKQDKEKVEKVEKEQVEKVKKEEDKRKE